MGSKRTAGQTLVGFAAEHGEGAVERGRAKLERKGLDAVVVNDISRSDIGFDSSDNEVTIVTSAGERHVAAVLQGRRRGGDPRRGGGASNKGGGAPAGALRSYLKRHEDELGRRIRAVQERQ